ncbi:transcription factor E2F8 [Hemicordylus capensis]|uniref:transcription factor E2F8 n=1 Tax=Hemicordylus capensis TaxID=884348 RepID=UPI0023043E5F|nr:transcription factor E2F8 [Hemicordylus capensis]XP_053140528.1 transcription factor E2F8 [Hemicordylus capensis]XP_053140529.1 transcription factor E2F8 [Hemicordylus capensis]XP_053140530.1 transcription factor E2F8 [Hemicordylus capensis]
MNERKVYSSKMNTEDKENQSFEEHESTVKTPLKQTAASNWILAEIQPAAFGHLTTPPKPNEISPGDPWTPTANLKMLISAASPEIRNREQEKRLSDSRSESLEDHLSGDEYEKSQPSRKEKSLGLLCHKFLARYPSYPNTSKNNYICLDEVAGELNVERRRIYDIMNVLESLHMVSRLAKNRYAWHGRHNLEKTLQVLKKVAEDNKYTQQIELIKKRELEQEPEGNGQNTELAKHVGSNDHTEILFVELPGMEFRAASVNSRKDKSLRVMSQKFVMLFLVSTPQVVSLEVAAKILIGEDHVEYLDKSKFKTKIRRLYDIANVLSSLELIEKIHVTEEKGRKPAFKWTGPSDVPGSQPVPTLSSVHPMEGKSPKEHCSKNLFPARSKQGFTRHPSLKLAKGTQNNRRKIHSAPSSPIKKSTSQIASSFPNKMAQLATICKQQLDEQSRKFKKIQMKQKHSTLPCPLASLPDSGLDSKQFVSPPSVGTLPLIQNSVSTGILSPVHSSYALYLHPSQTQIVTGYNPSFTVQPVPCANVIGMSSPTEASSKAAPDKISKDHGTHLEGDASVKDQNLCVAKEQDGTKDDSPPEKSFKRCMALLDDSPIKKYRSGELQDVLWGKSVKNKKLQSPLALHLDQEGLASSVEEQNKKGNTGQSLECQSEQRKHRGLLEGDGPVPPQELPAAFAVPEHKAWFSSGYLIPLAQCTKLGNETTLSNKEVYSAEPKPCSSLIAGGISVTSELTAINFPGFHITPLNLMLPPASVASVPVVNSTALALPAHANSTQIPNSSVVNFTLQHLGLIPASMHLSTAKAVLGSALVRQEAEQISSVSKSVGLKQEKALKIILPVPGHERNGKSASTTPLQQTTGSVASKVSQAGSKTYHTPGESATVPGSGSSSPESDCADGISQGTLLDPQRKLGESTEDKF